MKNFSDYAQAIPFESWILQAFCLITLGIVINLALCYFLRYASKVASLTHNTWDDSVLESARVPANILIWVIVAKLCFDLFAQEFFSQDYVYSGLVIKIATIIGFTWFLIRLIDRKFYSAINARRLDATSAGALSKLVKIIVMLLAALLIIQNFGFSISAILAAGGAGGLVIGFAAKDSFANLFGGLTIYMDRPFGVGDWIRCQEKQIEGVVEKIGWRHVKLRAFNMNPIYVPNAIFSTAVLENPSRMTHFRINDIISLRYRDAEKLPAIAAAIQEVLDCHEEIDHEVTKLVSFEKFSASSIDVMIRAFTKTTDWVTYRKIRQVILLKVIKIVFEHGAEFAFPTQTVHVEK